MICQRDNETQGDAMLGFFAKMPVLDPYQFLRLICQTEGLPMLKFNLHKVGTVPILNLHNVGTVP
jgi:hypothetical protein